MPVFNDEQITRIAKDAARSKSGLDFMTSLAKDESISDDELMKIGKTYKDETLIFNTARQYGLEDLPSRGYFGDIYHNISKGIDRTQEAAVTTFEGDVPLDDDKTVVGRIVKKQRADSMAIPPSREEVLNKGIHKDVAEGMQSVPLSLATGGTGFVAGTLASGGNPLIGAAAAAGTSFALMYKPAAQDFKRQVRDAIKEKYDITEEQWKTVLSEIDEAATKSGLAEAGGEALSSGLEYLLFGIPLASLGKPLAKIIGEPIAKKIISSTLINIGTKTAGTMAAELTGEGITQEAQTGQLAKTPYTKDLAPEYDENEPYPVRLAKATKEVAGPTMVASLFQAGGLGAVKGVIGGQKIANMSEDDLNKRIGNLEDLASKGGKLSQIQTTALNSYKEEMVKRKTPAITKEAALEKIKEAYSNGTDIVGLEESDTAKKLGITKEDISKIATPEKPKAQSEVKELPPMSGIAPKSAEQIVRERNQKLIEIEGAKEKYGFQPETVYAPLEVQLRTSFESKINDAIEQEKGLPETERIVSGLTPADIKGIEENIFKEWNKRAKAEQYSEPYLRELYAGLEDNAFRLFAQKAAQTDYTDIDRETLAPETPLETPPQPSLPVGTQSPGQTIMAAAAAAEAAKPKVEEPALTNISSEASPLKPGMAWVDNQQRPIYEVIKPKGKRNAGKVIVVLNNAGKKVKINETDIIRMPEAKEPENVSRETKTETLPDGSTVNWNKVETKEKDGLKATYYAVYNKDGSFKKWNTETEINRLKSLGGMTGLNLKQDNYGKQTGVTGKATKGKQAGLGLVVEDKNQPGMFKNEPKFTRAKSSDAEYLDAVNRGDMETAQRMVDDKLAQVNAYWHGTPSGDLRGGRSGLHVGTKQAATEALEARIGIPADGKGWDGSRTYGETLLAGRTRVASGQFGKYRETGYNADAPMEDFYAKDHNFPTTGNSVPVNPDWKPWVRPVLLVGKMSNTPNSAMSDVRANATMTGMLRKGSAKRGYFYVNEGEDAGSVSAVLPNGDTVRVKLPDPVTYDDNGNVIPLSKRFNAREDDIRFAKSKSSGMPITEVQKLANNLTAGMQNVAPIEVFQNIKDLNMPVDALDKMNKANVIDDNGNSDVAGMLWKSKIYLFADNISSDMDVARTVVKHEMFHDGFAKLMEKMAGRSKLFTGYNTDLKALLNEIWTARETEVRQHAKERQDQLKIDDKDAFVRDSARRRASEEWLANQTPASEVKWYDRLVAIFQNFMKAMGFKGFSDAQARVLISDAYGILKGKSANTEQFSQAPRFTIAEVLSQLDTKKFIGDSGNEYTGHDASGSLDLLSDKEFKDVTDTTKKEFLDGGGAIYFIPAGEKEANSIHSLSGEIVLSEDLKDNPKELKNKLLHELTHWGQIQRGDTPKAFYISPEESIRGFMEYLSDPAEVKARFNAEGLSAKEYDDFMEDLNWAKSDEAAKTNLKSVEIGEVKVENIKSWRMPLSYIKQEIEIAKSGRDKDYLSYFSSKHDPHLIKDIKELENIVSRPSSGKEIAKSEDVVRDKIEIVSARKPISDTNVSSVNLLLSSIKSKWTSRRLHFGDRLLKDNEIEYYEKPVMRVEVLGKHNIATGKRIKINPIIIESILEERTGIRGLAVGPNEIDIDLEGQNLKNLKKVQKIISKFKDSPKQIGTFSPTDPNIMFTFGESEGMPMFTRAAEELLKPENADRLMNILAYGSKQIDQDQAFNDTAINYHTKDPKDLYKGIRWFQTMFDLARNYPELRAILDVQTKRVASSHALTVADKEILQPFYALKDKKRVNDALLEGDKKNKEYYDMELKSIFHLTPEEIAGYRAVRKALNNKLDTFIHSMLKNAVSSTTKITPTMIKIVKTSSEPGQFHEQMVEKQGLSEHEFERISWMWKWAKEHEGYVPHKWDSKWLVKVVIGKANEYLLPIPTVKGQMLPTRGMRRAAAEEQATLVLRNKFGWSNSEINKMVKEGRIIVRRSSELPVDLFEGARLDVIQSIVNDARDKMFEEYAKNFDDDTVKKMDNVKDAINTYLKELYLAKGWGRHLMGRRGVKGYRTDVENVLAEYLAGANSFIAKGEAAKDFAQAMGKISVKETPVMWQHAKEYISDMLGDANEATVFKKIVGTYFLAGDASAAVLNMTQNWTHAVPMLKDIEPKDKRTAEADIAKGMKDVFNEYQRAKRAKRLLFSKANILFSQEEVDAYRKAYAEGHLDPAFMGETTGIQSNKIWQDTSQKIFTGLFKMFTGAEGWNRTSTFFAAYRRAKRAGMSEEGSYKKAVEIINTAHFVYGKGNRPLIVRNTGAIGNIAFTFMTYPLNNLVFLKHRIQDLLEAHTAGDKKATRKYMKILGANLGYLFAMGGLYGLPFSYLGQTVYNLFADDDDDWEVLMRKHMPKEVGRTISRGLPAAIIGNDFSWRVQGTDVLGLPIGFEIIKMGGKRIEKAQRFYEQDRLLDMVFVLTPDIVRSPYQAVMGAIEGGEATGRAPIKYTAGEAITRGLGFTPTREAEAYKVGEVIQTKKTLRTERLGDFAERYIIALENSEKMESLRKDIFEYNQKQKEKGVEGLPIMMSDIIKSAKIRIKDRRKGYLDRAPKYLHKYQDSIENSMGIERSAL